MATSANLHARLDAFWHDVSELRTDSPADKWDKYASYFAPNCSAYLYGMAAPPAASREEAVAVMKGLVATWELGERRVVSRSATEDGKTIVAEMDNHIKILGESIEHFPELEVVEFDAEGLVSSYRLYCDAAPVMAIFEKYKEKA